MKTLPILELLRLIQEKGKTKVLLRENVVMNDNLKTSGAILSGVSWNFVQFKSVSLRLRGTNIDYILIVFDVCSGRTGVSTHG